MDRGPKLDNAVFTGRLRREASAPYIRRPTPPPRKRSLDGVHAPVALKAELPAKLPQSSPTLFANLPPARPLRPLPPLPPIPPPVDKKPAQVDKPNDQKNHRPIAHYVLAAIVFAFGIGVSLAGLRTNDTAQAQVKKITQQAGASQADSSPPPSTVKPTAAQIANYSVAFDLPRYIDIPAIKVHARVMQTGIEQNGSLGTPYNVYDTAWYTGSSKPGEAGAMVIDGHISSWTTPGVFYNLPKLKPGDTIKITRGDAKVYKYSVVKTQLADAKSLDMSDLLVSQDVSKPGLSLISCSGDVIAGTNEFDKRIVIYAVME